MKIEVDKSTIKGEKEKVQAIKFKPSLDRSVYKEKKKIKATL